MTPSGDARERTIWKEALAPAPDCIPIQKLAEPLSETDTKHLASCPRCQAELALWQEFNASAPRAEEGAAVAWIAQELRRRSAAKPARQPGWWQRLMPVPVYRLSGALAAVLLLAGGVTVYTLRSHSGVAPKVVEEGALRSQAVTVLAPLGDLDARPLELRWQPVPAAATYQAEILEVDRHGLWKSETPQTRLAIPGNIRALMAPGKTLLWEVTARSSSGTLLGTSGLQKFRVKVKKSIGGEL